MTLYRIYCAKCKQYELHFKQFTKDLSDDTVDAITQFQCFKCGHITIENAPDVKIPWPIVYEQRQRWHASRCLQNRSRNIRIISYINRLLESNVISDNVIGQCLSDAEVNDIIESDAGAIELHNQWAQEHNNIIDKYKIKAANLHMQERNELCQCGSGLKFKKCCLNRIEQLNAECNNELSALKLAWNKIIYNDELFTFNWQQHITKLFETDDFIETDLKTIDTTQN